MSWQVKTRKASSTRENVARRGCNDRSIWNNKSIARQDRRFATAPLGTDEEAAGAPAMHKEIAQARWTEHGFAAQRSWSGACAFLVVAIVLIGIIILVGASFVSAPWI